jgi:3-oxoacyl-[acyl-carrier-protein] synthase-3
VSNADLALAVDTSDAWIVQRTGIRTRFLLTEGELPSDLGVAACQRALAAAGRESQDVDLLIVATTFPDMICPGTSAFVAQGLNLKRTPFFDLTAGCTGFVYGLALGASYIEAGLGEKVLVLGFEALSRVTDWSDRRTCVLFGDGAGAVLLEKSDGPNRILGLSLRGDPEKALLLHMPSGGTRRPASHETVDAREHFLRMEGSGVFRSAVPLMQAAMDDALAAAGLDRDQVDWIIPHQANVRIINAFADRLDLPRERIIVNVDRVANTSSASIPIALDEAVRDGRIKPGHVVVFTGFGAGVTYGAAVVRM